MKNFLLAAACIALFATNALAQSQSWVLFNNDLSFHADALVQLPDESVVMTGTIQETTPDSFYYTYATTAYAVRMSKAGNVMWAKQLDGVTTDYTGQTTLFYGNDALYIGFYGYDPILYTYNDGILKLDLNGNLLVSKKSDATTDYAYSTNKYAQLPNGNIVMMKSVSSEFKVICFDQDLNVEWSRSINPDPGTSKNPGLSMTVDGDSGIIVCGKSDNRLVVTALSPDGQFQYGHRYDNSALYLQGRNVYKVADGVIVQGLYMDYTGASYGSKSFVCKTNLQGNMQWFRVLEDANSSVYDFVISTARVTDNGHFMYTGTTGSGSAVCGELDGNGDLVWSRIADASAYYGYYYITYNSPMASSGDNAVFTHSESVYPFGATDQITFTTRSALANGEVCGFINSDVEVVDASYDYTIYNIPATSATTLAINYTAAAVTLTDVSQDFDVVEFCSTVTGIESANAGSQFNVSPNPAVDNIIISYSGATTELKIYNAIGMLVSTQTLNNGNTTVNVSELPSGMYIAVTNEAHQGVQKFTIQR